MKMPIRFLVLGLWFFPLFHAQSRGDDLRAELQARAVQYFLDNSNPKTGLVLDRAPNFTPSPRPNYKVASIAATGFGMAVLANAAANGLVDKTVAHDRIVLALNFSLNHLAQHSGWLYHFVDWDTGDRFALSEISTIDTALFLAGALYAAQVFPVPEIQNPANALYERADFVDMMTNGGSAKSKRVLSMGWLPESGYLLFDWEHYSELMLLVLLGLGHPTHPLPPEAWDAWARPEIELPGHRFFIGVDLPLFAHQYSHLFINFKNRADAYGNYYLNSITATIRDRTVCKLDQSSATFREGFWGLSASDSPAGYYPFSPLIRNGTICPACAGASAMFLPAIVMHDLTKWYHSKWHDSIWGRYGFVDSLNLDSQWFDRDVLGITVGPLYLSLANLKESTSVWKLFEEIPAIKRGLERSSLRSLPQTAFINQSDSSGKQILPMY